jgi:hypothetical protein
MAEEKTENKPTALHSLIGFLILFAGGWFGINWWIDHKVISDAVGQYEIVKRNGSARDACHQAKMVAAAYLRAKDEAEYQKWTAVTKEDCAVAGVL